MKETYILAHYCHQSSVLRCKRYVKLDQYVRKETYKRDLYFGASLSKVEEQSSADVIQICHTRPVYPKQKKMRRIQIVSAHQIMQLADVCFSVVVCVCAWK